MDDQYQLLTPEHVELSYDLAGLGSRFVAALVDALIQLVLFVLVGVAALVSAGTLMVLLASLSAPGQAALAAWMIGGGLALLFLILWGYYIFFELVWNGQSPGKRLVHIRVMREDGYPVGFLDSVVRNLVRVVDFLPAYYVIGLTVMLLDRRWRRLGDYAAGTVVVKERSYSAVGQLLPPAPASGARRVEGADRLAARDRALVREFLLRRASLLAERRQALAAELAESMAARLSCDRSGLDDEAFLEAIAGGMMNEE